MIPDCSSHQAELPTERESRDVLHEDEPLPGSVRPENEALLIRQEMLGTALVPEMQRAQRRAISGLMFFLSVVGFIFILVIHSVKAQSYNGAGSSGAGSGGGGGGGGSAGAAVAISERRTRRKWRPRHWRRAKGRGWLLLVLLQIASECMLIASLIRRVPLPVLVLLVLRRLLMLILL